MGRSPCGPHPPRPGRGEAKTTEMFLRWSTFPSWAEQYFLSFSPGSYPSFCVRRATSPDPRARRDHRHRPAASLDAQNGKCRRSTHDTHSRVGTDTYQFQYEVSSVLFTTSAVCSVGMLNDPHGSQPLARRRPRCPLAHRLPNSIAPHAPSAPHATACARAPRSHPRCCLVVKFVRKMAFTEYRFGGLSQGHQTNVLPLSKARDTRTFPSCPPCPSYTRRSLY